MRVLIVDDDPCFRIPLRATLALQGFHVKTADSAESAEELLGHEDFDAVLSDIGLPDIDGITLAARHPDVPFVLMSGSPPPEERASGSPRTERVRLVKPFDTVDVIAALRAVVNRLHAAHQRSDGIDVSLHEQHRVRAALSHHRPGRHAPDCSLRDAGDPETRHLARGRNRSDAQSGVTAKDGVDGGSPS